MYRESSSIRHAWPLLLVLLAACAAPQTHSTAASPAVSDADVMAQARQAEVDGKRLFDASSQAAAGKPAEVAAARAAIKDYCEGMSYKTVEVDDARPGQDFVYLIASSGDADDIVWGRHYRVAVDQASGAVSGVAPSTHSCLAMSLTKGLPAGATMVSPSITHLLSPGPSEFHVYLSLALAKPITVMTSYGLWTVEAGKISLLEKRPAK
ncbi:MAG TPA: hypothetical protein VGM16_06015 [Gammaproteobacteria bacterium]|jgi:hypothetical protein